MPKHKKHLKKKKIAPTAQQIEQRKQKNSVRGVFRRIGFERVRVDGTQFTFMNRTGEIDDLFIYENIVILCEYTVGQSTTGHITKKKLLYDLILANPDAWVKLFKAKHQKFESIVAQKNYLPDQYKIRIVYVSSLGVSDEIESACPEFYFMDGARFRYFESLSKTIHRSARFELFKYFKLGFKDVGSEVNNTSEVSKTFPGYVLPENFSSFPAHFKVVSFYADPATLLQMSYVLRRDSWLDKEGLYQRILLRSKIRNMRRYLTTDKRVFVNNIIVTLPKETKLNDPEHHGVNLDPKTLTKVANVMVSIPHRTDTVGIVDGQHRIYCYHEGSDKFEGGISKIRGRQNLLVTGIIFPDSYSEANKRKFEAKLFLEINDTQARAKSDLKQSIELILNPHSTIAIAKAIIQRLSETGPLKGLLQTNYFDPPELIKTTSIVSYGLKPLVKLDGNDSLFHVWGETKKGLLKTSGDSKDPTLLSSYIEFCATTINDLLIAAKLASGADKWKLDPSKKNHVLSPTVLNGFLVCLRLLISNGKVQSAKSYEKRLNGLSGFSFGSYKSSHWRLLGDALFKKYFA